mgnify:CR=1 FL=1
MCFRGSTIREKMNRADRYVLSAQPVDKPALGIGRERVCCVNVEKIAEEVQKPKQMQ